MEYTGAVKAGGKPAATARPSLPSHPNFWLAAERPKNHNARLKIEHFALQVADPVAMADWYVQQLGFSIARKGGEPAHARFLVDSSGSVMLEIYRNPAVGVPDYKSIDPLFMHVAYISDNPAADRNRLVEGGAVVIDDLTTTPAGDVIVMLRDPWGVPIQLVKRGKAML